MGGRGGLGGGRSTIVVYKCGAKSTNERFSNHTHKLRVHFSFVFRLQRTADHSADAFFEEYRVGSSQAIRGVVGRVD